MSTAISGWRLLSATVPGSRHLALGLASDDAIGTLQFDPSSWVVVVADGAGSARHASRGSALAVEHGTKYLATILTQISDFTGDALKSALHDCALQIHDAISEESNHTCEPIAEFATTLIVICATPLWLAALQIGDGGVAIHRVGESISMLFHPLRGQYINETFFVTSSDFRDYQELAVLPIDKIDRIAAFTDGVEFLGVSMKENRPHARFFDPLFEFALTDNATTEELNSFLSSEKVCNRTDDDKTLFLAVRK